MKHGETIHGLLGNALEQKTSAQVTGPHSFPGAYALMIVQQWLGARGYRFRAETCPPKWHKRVINGQAYKTF